MSANAKISLLRKRKVDNEFETLLRRAFEYLRVRPQIVRDGGSGKDNLLAIENSGDRRGTQ